MNIILLNFSTSRKRNYTGNMQNLTTLKGTSYLTFWFNDCQRNAQKRRETEENSREKFY